jgi:hypothetical protein
MGQLHSTCAAGVRRFVRFNNPKVHAAEADHLRPADVLAARVPGQAELEQSLRVVALQVAFERQILKPVFHMIGYRLWV